jgi:heptosyltransferase-3
MTSAPPDRVPLARIGRVLVTKLRHHGDVLLASPVLTTLKRALPAAEIDALVYAETAPMLAHHPALAKLHTIDRAWKRQGLLAQMRAEGRLARTLAARRYDLLVHLTEHPRGLWLALLGRPAFAVTRARRSDERSWLWRRVFTHFYPLPKGTRRHTVETNLDALRRIGIQPSADDKRLVLVPGRDAELRADALLAERALVPRGFIHVHPGSRWMFKCWPAGRTATLVERLVRAGHAIVVTGAPDERERALVDVILAMLPDACREQVVDLTGRLSLPELAALAARARLFVGVDSAPMHIAAAVGTPAVALFGPSDDVEWSPWGTAHRVVASPEFPCRPCRNDGCGGGKVSECLTTLPVDRVMAAVDALLAETASADVPH